MDINALLSNPGVYESAFQNSRQAEMQNQMRQAQAQQLIQEVMQKQQMMPLELEKAGAYTDFMRAQAEKMRREPQETNAKRLAEAAMAKANEGRLRDFMLLNKAKAGGPQSFNQVYGQLSPDTQSLFAKPGAEKGVWEYSPEELDSAIDVISRSHPELAKTMRESIKQEANTARNQASIESRENIAKWANEAKIKHATELASAKTPSNLQALAVKYKTQADNEPDPDKKAELLKMSNMALENAFKMATAGAEARATGTVDIGQMGDGIPTREAPKPPKFEETKPKYDMSKY